MVLLLGSLAAAWVLGCGAPAPDSEEETLRPLHIGFLVVDPATLTGDQLAARQRENQGQIDSARLAVARMKARGGVRVAGELYDPVLHVSAHANRPESAMQGAQQLIHQRHVMALVGPITSQMARPVAELAEQQRVPMITPTATRGDLTDGRSWVFRVAPDDGFQAAAAARFARQQLHVRRAALFYDVSNDYSRSLAEAFEQSFVAGGGKVVASESYVAGTTDFASAVARLQARDPDFVFAPNPVVEAEAQIRELRRAGLGVEIMIGDAWTADQAARLETFEGVYCLEYWTKNLQRPGNEDFITLYQTTVGHPPAASGALTFDAFGLLFDALERSPRLDGAALRETLASTQDFPGVTSNISFAGHGDPLRSFLIMQIRGGLRHVVHATGVREEVAGGATAEARPAS